LTSLASSFLSSTRSLDLLSLSAHKINTMPDAPALDVSGADAAAAHASPARGAEMLTFLQTRLNQKMRNPPLVHSWEFWHDRQSRSTTTAQPPGSTAHTNPVDPTPRADYENRLEFLALISNVKEFWSVFNNFDLAQLQLRDHVHLFHKGVKPVWEDARNVRGGSWTFRVPRAHTADFWRDLCLMAIGEQLQAAVDDPAKQSFRDDICGLSIGVRFNSMLVQVWNRDADHQAGIEAILATVLENLPDEYRPKEGTYYYKKHREHAGFAGAATT